MSNIVEGYSKTLTSESEIDDYPLTEATLYKNVLKIAKNLFPKSTNNINLSQLQFVEKLGEGAQGVVYKVKYKQEVFALKILNINYLISKEAHSSYTPAKILGKVLGWMDLALNEISIMQKIEHPALTKLVGLFFEKHPFVLSELCLCNMKQLKFPLTERQSNRFFVQLVEATNYLHSKGILHRDIKITNCLLSNAMNLKLTDFGLAIQLHGSCKKKTQNSVIGTPRFLPLECLEGDYMYSRRSDVFGIGRTVFYFLFGMHLRGDTNDVNTLVHFSKKYEETHVVILHGDDFEEIPIQKALEGLKCKDILSGMLAKDYKSRPTTEDLLKKFKNIYKILGVDKENLYFAGAEDCVKFPERNERIEPNENLKLEVNSWPEGATPQLNETAELIFGSLYLDPVPELDKAEGVIDAWKKQKIKKIIKELEDLIEVKDEGACGPLPQNPRVKEEDSSEEFVCIVRGGGNIFIQV